MPRRVWVASLCVCLCRSAVAADGAVAWRQDSLRFVAAGGYPRLVRLTDKSVLLTYETRRKSYARRSDDDGRTFGEPILVADFAFGSASNPQPLVLPDGTIWVLYNERPRDGVHAFTIRLTVSTDGGRTWTLRPEPLYTADTKFENGCWEPAAVRRETGEIEVYFANENRFRTTGEQEITMIRTADAGRTWSAPRPISFRAGHRDGMPVPVELLSGRVAVAIEDNGISADGEFKPAIVRSDAGDWPADAVTPADVEHRWPAVDRTWPKKAVLGAPYLCRLPGGPTVLSCQSSEDGPLRMTVYVGDADAKHFKNPSRPFPTDSGKEGLWNSLFVHDAHTVTAVSGTTIKGQYGLWLIDGVVR